MSMIESSAFTATCQSFTQAQSWSHQGRGSARGEDEPHQAERTKGGRAKEAALARAVVAVVGPAAPPRMRVIETSAFTATWQWVANTAMFLFPPQRAFARSPRFMTRRGGAAEAVDGSGHRAANRSVALTSSWTVPASRAE